MPKPKHDTLSQEDQAELDAKLADEGGEGGEGGDEQEAQDALSAIADAVSSLAVSMEMIQRHQMALVYLTRSLHPAETQITFHPDVFNAIYDDSDPFAEIDEVMAKLKADANAKMKAEGNPQADA